MADVTAEAEKRSIDLLKNLSTKHGFLASTEAVANYRRIFSRDGMIAGIASLGTSDNELIETFRKTLHTLKEYQDHTGRIPSNIDCDKKEVSYGMSVGRVDATLWYIIGATQFALCTKDGEFAETFRDSIEKALFYIECLEFNGRGLIYVPHGGDWADEYINHGYVLYDQLLYYIALKGALKLFRSENKAIHDKAHLVKNLIAVNYFPTIENKENKYVYNKVLFEHSLDRYRPPLPIAYFSSYSVRFHVDNFANSLLLLLDIVDDEQKEAISHTIELQRTNNKPSLIPAFHPVITEDNPLWGRLERNYLYSFKNKPYQYHNGGLWPLIHGFFISHLSEKACARETAAFAKILSKDNYIFPEYYNAKTGKPCGTLELSFSASGYLLAHAASCKNTPPLII